MTTVADRCRERQGSFVFICDVSPPRGADPALLKPAARLSADFLSVGYNPGGYASVNSAMAAAWLKGDSGHEVVFTVATRDMNRLAVQSLLLGAQLHGLENVVVLMGDRFTDLEREATRPVHDYTPTAMLRSVTALNRGLDYRGLRLRAPTRLCAGATIDLARGVDREVALTRAKVKAGAQFFLLQTVFDAAGPRGLLDRYAEMYGEALDRPVFCAVPMLTRGGLVFGETPARLRLEIERGRTGQELAVETIEALAGAGIRTIYLVPPILGHGDRDYDAAQSVLAAFRP